MLWKQKHMMWPVLATLVHPLWLAPTLSCVSFLILLPYSLLLVPVNLPLPSLVRTRSCCPAFRCFCPTDDVYPSLLILPHFKIWNHMNFACACCTPVGLPCSLLHLSLFSYCFHILCLSNLLRELFQGRNHFSKVYWKLRQCIYGEGWLHYSFVCCSL